MELRRQCTQVRFPHCSKKFCLFLINFTNCLSFVYISFILTSNFFSPLKNYIVVVSFWYLLFLYQKLRPRVSYVTLYLASSKLLFINFLFKKISVEAGHRAIMFSRVGGIQKDIMTEGLHFRLPWFNYPIIYDIRSRPRKISSPTGSKDLQMVNISLRVLSRPDAGQLPTMYRQLGLDYDEKVIKWNFTNFVRKCFKTYNFCRFYPAFATKYWNPWWPSSMPRNWSPNVSKYRCSWERSWPSGRGTLTSSSTTFQLQNWALARSTQQQSRPNRLPNRRLREQLSSWRGPSRRNSRKSYKPRERQKQQKWYPFSTILLFFFENVNFKNF